MSSPNDGEHVCPGSRMEVVTIDTFMRCPECSCDVYVTCYDHPDGTTRTMLIGHESPTGDTAKSEDLATWVKRTAHFTDEYWSQILYGGWSDAEAVDLLTFLDAAWGGLSEQGQMWAHAGKYTPELRRSGIMDGAQMTPLGRAMLERRRMLSDAVEQDTAKDERMREEGRAEERAAVVEAFMQYRRDIYPDGAAVDEVPDTMRDQLAEWFAAGAHVNDVTRDALAKREAASEERGHRDGFAEGHRLGGLETEAVDAKLIAAEQRIAELEAELATITEARDWWMKDAKVWLGPVEAERDALRAEVARRERAAAKKALEDAERAVRQEVHDESKDSDTAGDWLLGMIRAADVLAKRAAALGERTGGETP